MKCIGWGAPTLPPTTLRSSCNLSLRSRCAHRLWQSASPVLKAPLPKGGWHGAAVTGGFFSRTCGRAHGPCPTRCCVIGPGRTGPSTPTNLFVGADAHIGPPSRPLAKKLCHCHGRNAPVAIRPLLISFSYSAGHPPAPAPLPAARAEWAAPCKNTGTRPPHDPPAVYPGPLALCRRTSAPGSSE